MEKPILLANWIMCPDGTMLPSFHRHDYRVHETEDRAESDISPHTEREVRLSVVDGGSDYLRRGGKYTEMSVYSDDPFEVIRRFVCRGGRGKDSTEHLTWTPLFRINDEWLLALIEYESESNPTNLFLKYYEMELEYRKINNLTIE
jgi:hypothetical protein